MQAITYSRFGGLDVLQLASLPLPRTQAGQLSIRVHAGSINPLDRKIRRGEQRLLSGTHFPKIPGGDFAGVVEEVGPGVTGFAPGDAVYGGLGSFKTGYLAERISVPANIVAKLPKGVSFEVAAASATVGLAALQTLRDAARVRSGEHVLVYGASGGVGLFVLQFAKRLGAHVTALARNQELLREYGADVVLDRSAALPAAQFDVVLDLSTKLPFAQARRLLRAGGRYVDMEPGPAKLISATLRNPFRAHKHKFLLTKASHAAFSELAELLHTGALRAPPLRSFDLAQFHEAFAAAEGGGVPGKVVVRLAPNLSTDRPAT